jgi:alpha-galactosidase
MTLNTLLRRLVPALAGLGLVSATPAAAADEALARTPPMGWSTWYGVRCDYDAAVVRTMADRMVSLGLREAGYRYVNVDDCWAVARDAQDRLVAEPKRFPEGLKPIADHVHAQGLLFGVYTSAGSTTCQRDLQADASRLNIGSRGHEYADARQFAEMGADFVKVDWCGHHPTQNGPATYTLWRDALAASGRPMALSICEWGRSEPWKWAKGVGQLWRIAMDTLNCWSCTTDWDAIGVAQTFDRLAAVSAAGGPGGWNDPDNLMVGNGVLTLDQERSQMSVYAVAAAPLIIAADLRRIGPASLAILTNRSILAVNQDPLGKPGRRIRADAESELWARELADGRLAVVLHNRSSLPRTLSLASTELGWKVGASMRGREIWSGRSATGSGQLGWRVAGHGAAAFILDKPVEHRAVRPPV